MEPKLRGFIVQRRIDAYAVSNTVVMATSEKEAAQEARDNEYDCRWSDPNTITFDARNFVTLDEHGEEIAETEVGDF